MSGRHERSGCRQRACNTSRAPKRRRRNVLSSTSGQHACRRTRCRGQNLMKAAAIRKSRCNRYGSHSEGEPKPTRGSFMRETARTAAEAEHLSAGCRVLPGTTAEGSLKQYGDTHGGQDSGRQATPREEDIAVGTLRSQLGASSVTQRCATDPERGQTLKGKTFQLERCGTGKGFLTETQSASFRPSGLRIKRAEA
jgi:hypothetical protein